MDFSECMSETDDPAKCRMLRDDYLECLHHRREVLPACVSLDVRAAGRFAPGSVTSVSRGHKIWAWTLLPLALQFTRLNMITQRMGEAATHSGEQNSEAAAATSAPSESS